MKRLGFAVLVLVLSAACDSDNTTPTGVSLQGPIVFNAALSAANELPAISGAESGARGTCTITFDVPRDTLGNPTGDGTATFAMQLNGFPRGTATILAHIHTGIATVSGPVYVDTRLNPATALLLSDGTVNIAISAPVTQAQATAVAANPTGYYFNAHTPSNPAGAVRGQLSRVQ